MTPTTKSPRSLRIKPISRGLHQYQQHHLRPVRLRKNRRTAAGTRECTMTPVFDPGTFERLVDEVGSRADAIDYLITFTSLLPARTERIRRAIKTGNNEEVTDALLSLQASAAMAGAAQLQASVTQALAQQHEGLPPTDPLVRKLQRQADLFSEAVLDFHYNGYTPHHTSPPETPAD